MFMRKIAILFVIAGLAFIAFGGYQLIQTKQAQSKSLERVETLLTNKQEFTDDFSPADFAQDYEPSNGEEIGKLTIPKLEQQIAIVEGTHEDELEHGVGHYAGTAYPLQDDQIVLSGHRDTVFRRMGELDLGDILTVELEYGEYSYEIVETQIVDADDRTIIVPTSPDEVLTVTTCYPFSYIGSAPDRYIITAIPVDTQDD